jgi:hypothetical protein
LAEEAEAEVIRLGAGILAKEPSLYQDNPQTVASGIMRYYLVMNGVITSDPQLLSRVTGRSFITIESMYRRLATIDNS